MRYTAWDFIGKVIEHQVPYHERKHGQLFCDNKAKDILNLLLDECAQAGTTISTNCDIKNIEYDDHQYLLTTSLGNMTTPSVVVASSAAASKPGALYL